MERESPKKKDTNAEERRARSLENKSRSFTRKITPLRGGLVREMIRCGRANCKCASGSLHGPYYYRVWMARGRRFKAYVRKADLEQTKAGIEALHAQKRKRQEEAAEIKAILRENRETHRRLYAILRLGGLKV